DPPGHHDRLGHRAQDVLRRDGQDVAGQNDEVGELADREGTAFVLQEVRVGGAHGVAVDGGRDVDGLAGRPRGTAAQGTAGDRGVDADHGVHLGDVPVAGEGESCPGRVQAADRPRLVPAVGTDVRGPDLSGPADLGGAVPGLQAGDHATLGEARQVGGVQALHVDDLVPGVARPVDRLGVLDRVEDGADAAVAGGVDETLEAPCVELGQQIRELGRRIEGV